MAVIRFDDSNQILTDSTLEEIQSHIARIEPNAARAIIRGMKSGTVR